MQAKKEFYSLGIILTILLLLPAGAVHFGPFSMAIVLFPLLLFIWIFFYFRRRYAPQLPFTDVALYTVYMAIWMVAAWNNGDTASKGGAGFNSLFIGYGCCICGYLVFSRIITSRRCLHGIFTAIVVLVSLDAVISILQFNKSEMGFAIWAYCNPEQLANMTNNLMRMKEDLGEDQMLNIAFVPGFFGSNVYNGYFIATCAFFPLYRFFKARISWAKVIYAGCFAMVAYASFVIQQRNAFALFLLFTFLSFYLFRPRTSVVVGILAIIAFVLFNVGIDDQALGRYANMSSDAARERVYPLAVKYILDHFFLGGRVEFINIVGKSSHNIVFNSFIYSGFFGALMILTIYVRMCWKAVKQIISSFSQGLSVPTIFAFALLIFNLISLTHNNSLVTGEPIIFLMYAFMLRAQQFADQAAGNVVGKAGSVTPVTGDAKLRAYPL